MATLENKSQNQVVLKELCVASSLFSRMQGLLGSKGLSDEQGLWIHETSSIHTFFMGFAIDCVFLDKKLRVVSIKRDVKPARLVWPQWSATSVIEMRSGLASQKNIQIGDQLYVGT